jgi:hypothetical protein
MVRMDHRELDAGRLDGAALVHSDRRVRAARELAGEPQAHLVDARPHRPEAGSDRHCLAHVVEVAVGHEHDVASLDLGSGLRAVRVHQERVQDDGLPAGRADLEG